MKEKAWDVTLPYISAGWSDLGRFNAVFRGFRSFQKICNPALCSDFSEALYHKSMNDIDCRLRFNIHFLSKTVAFASVFIPETGCFESHDAFKPIRADQAAVDLCSVERTGCNLTP